MARFLDCLCDDNYEVLLISGIATPEELAEQWLILLAEFYDMNGQADATQWILQRDINRYQNHLFLVQQCVDFLNARWSPRVADSLRGLGYRFQPESEEPEKYRPLLEIVKNQSKTKYILLKQLIAELDARVKKLSEGRQKPNREYYDAMLVQIEEMQGTAYDYETLMTNKYIQLEKKFWRTVEAYEKLKENARK